MKRRDFIKNIALGSVAAAAVVTGCKREEKPHDIGGTALGEVPTDKMVYRESTTGDRVSLLGFGAMRLPTEYGLEAGRSNDPISQRRVNELVDYAMAHGVNYYDTAPVYCKGKSEAAWGEALSRHDRKKYFLATKLSNFAPETWSREKSLEIYHNSFKNLKTDYIDYMLLHSVGGSNAEFSSMELLNKRYFENGMLDFLIDERKAGRIRNLGFSFHGDIKVFDYMLSMHDTVHWDFVQIQMNYVDWKHANRENDDAPNADELYEKLDRLGIPIVIMEPLLGGQLASMSENINTLLQQRNPEQSIASWAFRFVGSFPRILTVLSGMTYMEHLQDNIRTYSPLVPCTDEENQLLEKVARLFIEHPTIPCTQCKYCMPCPYGLDIPTIFTHYNKMVNTGNVVTSSGDENYAEARRAFLVGYDRKVPGMRQADHCISCNECTKHCPQEIDIPAKMRKIDEYVESLKQNVL